MIILKIFKCIFMSYIKFKVFLRNVICKRISFRLRSFFYELEHQNSPVWAWGGQTSIPIFKMALKIISHRSVFWLFLPFFGY